MEENRTFSIREKLGNAFSNIQQAFVSDKKVTFVVIGVGILLVLFFVVLLVSFSRSKTLESLVTTQTPVTSSTQNSRKRMTSPPKLPATLTMVASGEKKNYKVGDLITFTIVGDSNGTQIRGYDAVFKFDSTKVSFVSEKNLYTAFTYQKRLRPDWVIITAAESISAIKKSVFYKTPLMGMTFKALAPGIAYFPFSYIPDSFNDSNLINTTSNDMLSNAIGISIQIIE